MVRFEDKPTVRGIKWAHCCCDTSVHICVVGVN